MIPKSRKFIIWLITSITVLVIFLVYTRFNKTVPIEIDKGSKTQGIVESYPDEDIGQVSKGVGVGTVDVARFIDLDPQTKQVAREWGFEQLLHQQGQEWEINKPFMNIYRSNFKCYITANTGTVLLESGTTRPIAKSAIFSGDVVIRIFSNSSKGVRQSNIYFDDIEFDSERSMFSTAGPVEFVSEQARMTGRGMELIYDDERNRLELLKVLRLETLRLKTEQNTELFSKAERADKPIEKSETPKETKPVSEVTIKQPVEKQEDKTKQLYKCIFSKNVVIDAPEQLIMAFDEFVINDIEGSEFEGDIAEEDTETVERKVIEEKKAAAIPEKIVESQQKIIEEKVNVQKPADVSTAKKIKQDVDKTYAEDRNREIQPTKTQSQPEKQLVDIIVTCDGGITIIPMDNPVEYSTLFDIVDEPKKARKSIQELEEDSNRTTFVADKIDYFYSRDGIGDIVVSGKSELIFYVEEEIKSDTNSSAVPVRVSAKKRAEFLPGKNTAVFEGGCVGRMVTEQENIRQKHTISAPKFTVVLSQEQERDNDLLSIKHFTASDGVVRLSSVKTSGDELLGGVELKCNRFDYNPSDQIFSAAGPGIITVDNSKMTKPRKKVGRFSLQKPCWAFVRDFEKLEFLFGTNKIIATAKPYETLRIDYFPVVGGEYGQQVSATANSMVANIVKMADGRDELSRLDAKGGVTYEEEARKTVWGTGKAVQFVGSDFTYDAEKSKITARGNQNQPCLLNGALVEGIEYNVESGSIKTAIVGPGTLQ